jgi:hypothetical protein
VNGLGNPLVFTMLGSIAWFTPYLAHTYLYVTGGNARKRIEADFGFGDVPLYSPGRYRHKTRTVAIAVVACVLILAMSFGLFLTRRHNEAYAFIDISNIYEIPQTPDLTAYAGNP